ncbi:hypothetical protein [Bradyrhizobium sp. 33ap4]|uniref:hypothetical protein n=1 Tax=Bradyrhizobium sp. 33ap4 TaxID=3061630 RepID=UPI0039777CB0
MHKATISVAVAEGMRGAEVRNLRTIRNPADQVAKLAMKVGKGDRQVSFCYEAGPCGYGLHGQLTGLGHTCIVVAPSLFPMKAGIARQSGWEASILIAARQAGDRVKTDRRDSAMLAKLHWSSDSGAK